MDYAARCRFTYARNASFMRVCQPSPVARKYSTTSGLYLTVTATLVGCFCGPRWPGRRTLPFAQNALTEAASLGSYGHSGSFTLAGAAAMAAAICFLLKVEGFEVGARFMFVTVTTGNQSSAVIALHPYQEDNAVAIPAQTLQALLAVMFALIFHRDHRGIENTSDLSQIDAVILEVPFPLGFVQVIIGSLSLQKAIRVKLFVTTVTLPFYKKGWSRRHCMVKCDCSGNREDDECHTATGMNATCCPG